jgi:hypothetical protein
MKQELPTDTSCTVVVSTAHGTWTLEARLTLNLTTSGIPPHTPGPPHVPSIPLRTLLSGLEDLLNTGDRSIRVNLEPGKVGRPE